MQKAALTRSRHAAAPARPSFAECSAPRSHVRVLSLPFFRSGFVQTVGGYLVNQFLEHEKHEQEKHQAQHPSTAPADDDASGIWSSASADWQEHDLDYVARYPAPVDDNSSARESHAPRHGPTIGPAAARGRMLLRELRARALATSSDEDEERLNAMDIPAQLLSQHPADALHSLSFSESELGVLPNYGAFSAPHGPLEPQQPSARAPADLFLENNIAPAPGLAWTPEGPMSSSDVPLIGGAAPGQHRLPLGSGPAGGATAVLMQAAPAPPVDGMESDEQESRCVQLRRPPCKVVSEMGVGPEARPRVAARAEAEARRADATVHMPELDARKAVWGEAGWPYARSVDAAEELKRNISGQDVERGSPSPPLP
ncbi:hypothetical protein HYH03_004184 [Edaphochlamys debaryana]|uniref:Uncharacterized protein n=1 Tax=Edaphochlamys debaryana TaxID=47281 RepID=A0A836C2L4_9CHLO|nr:hypothetical protein HYH03_004184 [Edaphochlamys debaryana]|eukprot:KAG2497920.1 hypothetical protein HYH03_004184 [Edaphochlamys debaryana]